MKQLFLILTLIPTLGLGQPIELNDWTFISCDGIIYDLYSNIQNDNIVVSEIFLAETNSSGDVGLRPSALLEMSETQEFYSSYESNNSFVYLNNIYYDVDRLMLGFGSTNITFPCDYASILQNTYNLTYSMYASSVFDNPEVNEIIYHTKLYLEFPNSSLAFEPWFNNSVKLIYRKDENDNVLLDYMGFSRDSVKAILDIHLPPISTTNVNEINTKQTKKLIKIMDLVGREVEESSNTPLLYLYDDGSVVKKVIIN